MKSVTILSLTSPPPKRNHEVQPLRDGLIHNSKHELPSGADLWAQVCSNAKQHKLEGVSNNEKGRSLTVRENEAQE